MASRKKNTVDVAELAAATTASVRAALAKAQVKPPRRVGTMVGGVVDSKSLGTKDPTAIAKEVAKGVSASTGIKTKARVMRTDAGIWIGYIIDIITGGGP